MNSVRHIEDVYSTIKHIGARHGKGGYGVAPEHMKVRHFLYCSSIKISSAYMQCRKDYGFIGT